MAPDSLVCHITDGSVPARVALERSVPSHPNPASTPAPGTMTTRTEVWLWQGIGDCRYMCLIQVKRAFE